MINGAHFTSDSIASFNDRWIHLALTYDRSKVRQYVNGTLVKETVLTDTIKEVPVSLQIGRRLPGSYYFVGQIDELRVYDHALSTPEIETVYASS